jgi:Protein of unknown function (DUF551)
MKWKTIDSVPRDGTSVLLCKAIDAEGKPIDWMEDLHTAQVWVQVAAWWSSGEWIVYCSLVDEPRLHFEPTHWMPLPKPPKLAEEKQ